MAVTPGYLDVTWTSSGASNAYSYNTLTSVSSYTIQTGDHVEYDVQWVSAPSSSLTYAAFDFGTTNGNTLRDNSNRVDQNGLGPHPASNLSAYATGAWYHRKISLSNLVGQSINQFLLATEGDAAGTYRAYFRQIFITDGHGNVRKTIYSNVDTTVTSPSAPSTGTAYNNGTTLTSITAVAAQTTTGSAAPSYAVDYVLADGPFAYWRLSDLADAAGTPHNLTNNGSVGFNNARLLSSADAGTSASFDTSQTQYLSVASDPSFNVNNLTIVAWIKAPTSLSGQFHAIVGRQSGVRDYNFYLWSQNNDGIYDSLHFSSANAGSSVYQGSIKINDGLPHMVAVTVGSDGKQTYFLDGVQVAQSTQTAGWTISSSNPIWIGRADNYFVGNISDVALFNTVLTPTKIANYYTVGTGGTVSSSSGTVVSTGGGSGVGNMFGGYFLGETLLGADPGSGSDSSGSGTGVGNMLGGFFVGETMLGGDQAAGSGSAPVVTSGAVYSMGGSVTGRTTVSATPKLAISLRAAVTCRTSFTLPNLTQSSLRAGTSVCGTTVTGRLSTASYLTTQNITCRTTVTATMRKVIPALSATAITCSTIVTAALTRSTLRGQNIYSPFNVTGTLSLTPLQIRVEGVRGSTSPITGRLGLARAFTATSNISCGTTVTANMTYSSRLSGGSVVDYTTITGDLTRSYLRGTIACGTTVTAATPTVKSAYNGTIIGRTTVAVAEGGFRRTLRSLLSTDVQTIVCGTTVHGRTYVTPLDFVPIYLQTSTRIVANLGLQLRFGSAALSNFSHGKTTVTGFITGLQTLTGLIKGKTTVTGKAKAGFGGEVLAYGYVIGSLGIRYSLTAARVGVIRCKTTVVVGTPRNGTSGRVWGGTRFAYTYGTPDALIPAGYDYTYTPPLLVYGKYIGGDRNYDYYSPYGNNPYYQPHFPTLGIYIAIKPAAISGSTRLRSLVVPSRAWAHNMKGNPPYYGPYGSVSLYISPKGDVGLGDFIDGSTVVAANMLALRHRLFQLFGATGLQAPGQIVFTGDAARGLGTKLVTGGPAVKILAERAPVKQTAYYV